MTVRISNAVKSLMATAFANAVDAGASPGVMEIRTGAQPATADTAVSGTLLATVTLIKPAFGSASNGVVTMADPASVNAVAAGTAGYYRIKDSNGLTITDGSITGTGGGGDLELSNTSLAVGQAVDITSGGTFTMPG